jgi:hypothetical protein
MIAGGLSQLDKMFSLLNELMLIPWSMLANAFLVYLLIFFFIAMKPYIQVL